ncbi:hypothetical protein SAMN05216567_112114 [Variovorax sp. OK605]|jgi:hypothetical protein|nr:hypothetical protein SAMN05216567_112114 [Variovorax sp. OK605]
MFAAHMSTRIKKAVLLAGAMVLAAGSAAAQPAPKPPMPAEVDGSKQGADKAMVVKPPATKVDPRLAKPAPRDKDPGLIEKPPADANPGAASGSGAAPSRQDDCRGAAADCKQNTPR